MVLDTSLQYGSFFYKFLIFCVLFCEPLGYRNNGKILGSKNRFADTARSDFYKLNSYGILSQIFGMIWSSFLVRLTGVCMLILQT